MIFRGQTVNKLSRSSLRGLSIGRNQSIAGSAERVPASLSILLGHLRLDSGAQSSLYTPVSRRNYADRPVSRPKAHTGRTTSAPRKKAAVSTGETGTTVPKTSTRGAKAKRSSKSKSRPSSKSKAKSKSKPKKTVKRKAKLKKVAKRKATKKVLTEEQKVTLVATKNKLKIKDLKKVALQPPSPGTTTSWTVFLKEKWGEIKSSTENTKLSDLAKQAKTRYRELQPEQIEHYNHIANQNRANYNLEYRKWIESHSPAEILHANNARLNLRRKGHRFLLLKDERRVRLPRNGYIQWSAERRVTGDYKGMSPADASRLMGKEWSELPEEDKKKWNDLGTEDIQRYMQEKKAVYKSDTTKSSAA